MADRSEMADVSHFVKKLRIDLKWPEMRSKVIFGHPKWPTAAILSFKMGFGGYFVKQTFLKIRVDMKWP